MGWPPIRSFRKNTMATNPIKSSDDAEGKPGLGCLYVKVSMDGAPYLRKVDLKTYSNYMELSSELEKMFSCFTIGELRSILSGLLVISFVFWYNYFPLFVFLELVSALLSLLVGALSWSSPKGKGGLSQIRSWQ